MFLNSSSALALASMLAAAAPVAALAQDASVDEVIVTASRTGLEPREIGSAVSVIQAQEIRQKQIVFVKDVLQDVPGVQVTSDRPGSFTNVSIRGSNNDEVLFLIDGVELGDPSATSTQYQSDHLTAADVDRIEVLKGNQSSLYGSDAIGGVINIITKRAAEEGVSFNIEGEGGSYGTRRGGGSLLGKRGPLDYRLTVTAEHQDGPSLADPNFGPATEDDEYSRWSASGRVGLAFAPGFEVQATGFYNQTTSDLDDTGADNGPFSSYKVDKDEYAFAGKLNHRTEDGRWTNELIGSRYWVQRLYKGPFSLANGDEYEGFKTVFNYVTSYRFNDMLKVAAGANYDRERTEQETSYSGDFRAGVSTKSVFGELAMTPVSNLSLTGAIRRDDNSRFGVFNTFRLTGAYTVEGVFGGSAKLRASYGTGAKAPGLYQLFDPTYGNPNLKAERSRGADVGVDLAWPRFSLEATLFRNRVRNEISFGFTGVRSGYIQFGKTRSDGLELGATFKPTDWLSLSQSYTYLVADNGETGTWLGRPRHSGETSVTVSPTDKLEFTARARYRSRNTSSYGGATASFLTVDLMGSYKVRRNLELYARVVNLFDEDYQLSFGENALDRSGYVGFRATF